MVLIFGGLAFAVGLVGCLAFIAVRSMGDATEPAKQVASIAPPRPAPAKQVPAVEQLVMPATSSGLAVLKMSATELTKFLKRELPAIKEIGDLKYQIGTSGLVVGGRDGVAKLSQIEVAVLRLDDIPLLMILMDLMHELMPNWSFDESGTWLGKTLDGAQFDSVTVSEPHDGVIVTAQKKREKQVVYVVVTFLPLR